MYEYMTWDAYLPGLKSEAPHRATARGTATSNCADPNY